MKLLLQLCLLCVIVQEIFTAERQRFPDRGPHNLSHQNARPRHQPSPSAVRIVSLLEKKAGNKEVHMERALAEWKRMNGGSQNLPAAEKNMKEILTVMVAKVKADYLRQNTQSNQNSTGNSIVLRATLKFLVEATPSEARLRVFEFFTRRLQHSKTADLMSLDDALVLGYIWEQEVIGKGLAATPPANTAVTSSVVHRVSSLNDFLVRNVVRAANRQYPPATGNGEAVTLSDWWLRQRQHSGSVYKVYNFIKSLVTTCQQNGVEVATIYESMVDEYKKSGRELDTYELNMVDYLAYQIFGMIEHADPERW